MCHPIRLMHGAGAVRPITGLRGCAVVRSSLLQVLRHLEEAARLLNAKFPNTRCGMTAWH